MAEDRVIDLLASSDSGETYAFDFSVQGSCLVVLVAIIGFEGEMPVRGFEREKPALNGEKFNRIGEVQLEHIADVAGSQLVALGQRETKSITLDAMYRQTRSWRWRDSSPTAPRSPGGWLLSEFNAVT